MDPHADSPMPTVSNLIPSWDTRSDGGGTFEPATAATVVERVVQGVSERRARGRAERPTVTPPAQFDAVPPVEPIDVVMPVEPLEVDAPAERPSAFSYAALEAREESFEQRGSGVMADLLAAPERDDDGLPYVDYDALERRDIAKELLRARLVAIAEQRELRTAYEIVFILLAAAVAVLLAAPPLVQVLLAAHGVQA